MTRYKKKILVDLDGVLNEYKGNYEENVLPKLKQGAKEFLLKLTEKYELYLFTTRNLMLSTKWLIQNDIDKYFKDITNVKIPSYLYIDDRCICFRGKYNDTLAEIDNFEVHWENKNFNIKFYFGNSIIYQLFTSYLSFIYPPPYFA